jgi:hypothetical protein
VALPPTGGLVGPAAVLIGRLTIGDGFVRHVVPHIHHPLGDVLAEVAGLAPLNIQPWRILMGAVVGMRAIVDACGLAVGIPLFDLLAPCRYLWLIARAIAPTSQDLGLSDGQLRLAEYPPEDNPDAIARVSCTPLAAQGATVADSVDNAFATADPIILMLANAQAMPASWVTRPGTSHGACAERPSSRWARSCRKNPQRSPEPSWPLVACMSKRRVRFAQTG